jgi:thiamine kinase-like enzyme/predicted nucleotidyltransferase
METNLIWTPKHPTIWTPAPMQTPALKEGGGVIKTPERFLTFLIPHFLYYLNQQLGRNVKSYLAFNGVGLSIQKNANEAGMDQYAYNTKQISAVMEWLDKRFGIEDYELFRDDDPDFKEYILERVIPYLFEQGKIEIKEKKCNVCSDCGNIISVAEVEATAPCNACGSKNNGQKELDVLVGYFDGNKLYHGITEDEKTVEIGVKDRFVTKIPFPLKGYYQELPEEVLLSRTNRNNGISLDKWGLEEQFLDPEMVLGLYSSYIRSEEEQKVFIFQGANTANKVTHYGANFGPFARNDYCGLHPKIPSDTFEKFLTGKNPATIPFLTRHLPFILANSSRNFSDLKAQDIERLWDEFLKLRKTAILFLVSQAGYKMSANMSQEGYLTGEQVSNLHIPASSNGQSVIPDQKLLRELNKTLSQCIKMDLTQLDMQKLLPLISSFFDLSPDSEELKYPEIRESLRQYIKANPILKQRIVTLVHFGSTATGDNKPSSDLDLNLVVDKIDKEIILEIQKMIAELKKSFPDNKFDFSFRSQDEFKNPNGNLIEFLHYCHGNLFLGNLINTGVEIYGIESDFYKNILNQYNNSENNTINIPNPFRTFIKDHFKFKEAILMQDLNYQYKKFFGRILYTFLSQVGVALPQNPVTSDFKGIFALFKIHFGDAYNNLEIIDRYLEKEDIFLPTQEESVAMLILLEDLMRVQNKFIDPQFDVEKDQSLNEIKLRSNKKVSLYRDYVTGNYIKIGNISLLKQELKRNSELRKLGFELPQQKAGIYQILPSLEILCYTEEKDLGKDYYSLMNEQESKEKNYFVPISEVLTNHAKKQIDINLSKVETLDIPDFLQKHIESLKKSTTLPENIKNKLDDFINKLTLRLKELPQVWCHNDLHTKNITEGGIIDWEHAGINYFGYDLVLPFFINENLEFSQEAQTKEVESEYFSYLKRIRYYTKIDLKHYLNDFIALKILLLCAGIEQRQDLQEERYQLLDSVIDKYIKNEPLDENLFKIKPY